MPHIVRRGKAASIPIAVLHVYGNPHHQGVIFYGAPPPMTYPRIITIGDHLSDYRRAIVDSDYIVAVGCNK